VRRLRETLGVESLPARFKARAEGVIANLAPLANGLSEEQLTRALKFPEFAFQARFYQRWLKESESLLESVVDEMHVPAASGLQRAFSNGCVASINDTLVPGHGLALAPLEIGTRLTPPPLQSLQGALDLLQNQHEKAFGLVGRNVWRVIVHDRTDLGAARAHGQDDLPGQIVFPWPPILPKQLSEPPPSWALDHYTALVLVGGAARLEFFGKWRHPAPSLISKELQGRGGVKSFDQFKDAARVLARVSFGLDALDALDATSASRAGALRTTLDEDIQLAGQLLTLPKSALSDNGIAEQDRLKAQLGEFRRRLSSGQ
jgi:hypothetical protein